MLSIKVSFMTVTEAILKSNFSFLFFRKNKDYGKCPKISNTLFHTILA